MFTRPFVLVAALAVALYASFAAPRTGIAQSRTKGAKPATPAGKLPPPIASIEGISEYRLDNGLQVLLFPDSSKPDITINLTVFVGSRHEGYGETGMAHLLEHMVFKGTPDHPTIPQDLNARGARFNGTTWLDRTNYYETLKASDDNLEFAIALEADRMVNSFVKREDLVSEMTVVRNEFEMGENSPANILSQRVLAVAFEWHNYGKSTIGNRTDIERVPIERLQAFYKKHYQPDNAMLVVAGKFEPAKALELAKKHFGKIPRPARKLETTYTEEPTQDGERSVTLRRVGDVAMVDMAYHVPAGTHPDMAAIELLSNILATPPGGRLYKALVESKLATSVSAQAYSLHDPGVLELQAEVPKEGDPHAVAAAMTTEIDKIAAEGVSAEEVDRARQQYLKSREQTASDPTRVAIQLSDWAAQGDWRLYFLARDAIEKVTPDDVRAAAAAYLRADNRTVGVFIPTATPERSEIPAAPDLTPILADYKGREAVSAGEEFDPSPTNIESRVQRSKLASGLKLALLPKKTRGESVHLRLNLRYGNLENLQGFETAARFLPELMTRGTKGLSRQQIQDALDKQGATLSASGDVGVATFTVQTKRENLPAVLALLTEILREPSLPESEFEILRGQQLASMEESRNDPRALAMIQVRRTVSPYDPKDVRYQASVDEMIDRLKNATLEQITRLHGEYLGAGAGELAIVGDFDMDAATSALEAALGNWNAKQPYARLPRLMFPDIKGSKADVRTPDKANAVYAAGEAFPLRDDHPEYAALVMGDYILGGGILSSRLADRVRQKEGLSYGVMSRTMAEPLDERASLTIMAICNPDNMPKVEAAISEEIARLLADGITQEELARAKSGYLENQLGSRANDQSLVGILADTAYVGRDMKFYADFETRISQVTPESAVAALRKYIDPERLVIVEAGDFKAAKKE